MSQQKTEPDFSRIHLRLFLTFFHIGLFTFGGGFAMLPLIEREITDNKKWIKPEELIDMIALAQSMPGPVAVNASIFIGRHLRGLSGALSALLGCVLPSVLVILTIAIGTASFQDNLIVQQFFTGILAAVTALILMTAIKMARRVVKDWLTAVLAIAAALLVAFFRVHALLTIIGGGLLGFILYWINPALVRRITGADRPGRGKHAAKQDGEPSRTNKGAES